MDDTNKDLEKDNANIEISKSNEKSDSNQHDNISNENLDNDFKDKNNVNLKNQNSKSKKEMEFKINSGNIAIIASSISLLLSVVNRLLRMLVLVSPGLIIFLYILSGILSFFALFCCIKNTIQNKQIAVDSYFCGISIVVLILI